MTSDGSSVQKRALWIFVPPLLYLILSFICIWMRMERAMNLISSPGFFLAYLLNIGGHGGYELILIPNLVLHAAFGFAATFMETPGRRFGLYFLGVALMGILASIAGTLLQRISTQAYSFQSVQRSWRERIPAQRKLLVEEDFQRGVNFWDSFCGPNIKLFDHKQFSTLPHCPDGSSHFENAARLASPEQKEIRCLSYLYIATYKATMPLGAQAQQAFSEWAKCSGIKRTERVAELESTYARHIPMALHDETAQKLMREQFAKQRRR